MLLLQHLHYTGCKEHPAGNDKEHPADSDKEHPADSDRQHPADSDKEHTAGSDKEHLADSDKEHPAGSDKEHSAGSDKEKQDTSRDSITPRLPFWTCGTYHKHVVISISYLLYQCHTNGSD